MSPETVSSVRLAESGEWISGITGAAWDARWIIIRSVDAATRGVATQISQDIHVTLEDRTARLTILVDPRKKALFERLCADEDATPSQVLRRLIRRYIEERTGQPWLPSEATQKPTSRSGARRGASTGPARGPTRGRS